ncbi:MAG: RIP metalloprotease RseP [Lentimicrobiaceae bacterium]|nr:RIP metalloprotease RseP [Lentimicrobiaceae bacterium]
MQVLGFILALSLLVFVHELGHYFFAVIFKTRVEKFYLFFNPGLSLLRMKKIDGKRQFSFFSTKSPEEWTAHPESTEWGIGWLPFGGYCSISGMVDETKSAKDLASEPQPYEFRSKPAWQRFFIIVGGVLMNFLTAMILYIALMFTWGKQYIPLENAHYGLAFSDAAQYAGFKNGDKIVSVDGETPHLLMDFIKKLLLDNPKEVVVLRNNNIETLHLKEDNWKKLLGEQFCTYDFPFVIEEVTPGAPAAQAGLMQGDSLVGIDTLQIYLFSDFQEELKYAKNKEVTLHFYRDNSLQSLPLFVNEEGKIGVSVESPYKYLQTVTDNYNFIESIPQGIKEGVNTLTFYIKQFKRVFTKEGSTQIGGFITLGKFFPKSWNWEHFWSMVAFLSVILAFMNILPIPALDGGYIFFILFEMITGKRPGDKFIGYANTVGFAILIALLLYANGMDLFRLFK